MHKNEFYTEIKFRPLMTVIIFIIIALCFCLFFTIYFIARKIGSKGIMENSALQLEQKIEDGYIGVPDNLKRYIGAKGISLSDLRPAGKIKIGDEIIDAVSMNQFIEAGKNVKIIKYENTQLYVLEDNE